MKTVFFSFLVSLSLSYQFSVWAENIEHVPFCDLVRERAVGLLTYRFSDSFDLADAKAHTPNERFFESMLRHAWMTKRGRPNERAKQIEDFGEHWYGECILAGYGE